MAEGDDEPTVECPNCGALVPIGAPRCFICEELMPEPPKAEVKPSELSPEELPPVEKVVIEAPQPAQEESVEPIAEPVVEKPPEEIHAPAEEIIEPEPAKPTPAEEKAAKLKAAYEAGRIPTEVYVGNLRALGIAVPPELEPPPVEVEMTPEVQPEIAVEVPSVVEEAKEKPPEESPPVETISLDEKAAKLKTAYDAGVLTKEAYVENLKALGAAVPTELEEQPIVEESPAIVPPEVQITAPPVREEIAPPKVEEKPAVIAPVEEAKAPPPARPSNLERKKARLKKAYKTGRITKELYVDSLKTLGLPVPQELEGPPAEKEEPKEVVPETPAEILPAKEEAASPEAEEAAPVEAAPAEEARESPPAKPSAVERKAARLKRAYESGKITKGIYADSLEKLGIALPPELEVAPEQEAAPEEKPPFEAPPAEEVREEPLAEPSKDEVKAARLKAAYDAGTIPKEVYAGNLRILGLPVPPELEELAVEVPSEAAQAEVRPIQEEAAPEAVSEEVPQIEEETSAEAPLEEVAMPEVVEEVPAAVEAISKGEIEGPTRSYRGVAIASAGGLVYVLVWLLFIPMLGTSLSFVFTALGAILIVVGYNIASNDAAAAKRARTFKCPLCSERLDVSVSECPNCGAKFSE